MKIENLTIPELIKLVEEKNYELRRAKQLATKQGFISAYYELCSTERTNEDAFYKLSDEYEEIFKECCAYSSYDSFRKVLTKKYKSA